MEICFFVGNVIMSIGTIELVYAVMKDRRKLFGYNLTGSILTLTGLITFMIGYIATEQWLSILFSSVTTFYWGYVVIFKIKNGNDKIEKILEK